jgi:phospholipase C
MAEIQHVVVLMLENRSFESLLGRLYPDRADFDGLTGDESNRVGDQEIRVWSSASSPGLDTRIPAPDPAELFVDMNEQIFGPDGDGKTATMAGFASNYARVAGADPKSVMHYYTPEQVPVLSTLARSFGVSDRWHASAPNQTWPNRFFAHCGTANGYVNNMPLHVPYMMWTVFNRLTEAHRSWRIYFHDIPQSATLARTWSELPDHLKLFEEHFMADAMAGRLPNYSFIEPRYFTCAAVNRVPNDQHPPHDVMLGERLIARCYDAIRNGPGWDQTLFIITYDEHGGLYDHVPPPPAVSPDNHFPEGFKFDCYGVRVPAVLISPWIPAGSVIRPSGSTPFDHTSIIATLRKLFDIGPLTARDAAAPDLLSALSLDSPSNPGPAYLPMPAFPPAPEEVLAAADVAPNHMQQALAQFTSALPSGSAGAANAIRLAELTATMVGKEAGATVAEALTKAETGLTRFLHGAGAGL